MRCSLLVVVMLAGCATTAPPQPAVAPAPQGLHSLGPSVLPATSITYTATSTVDGRSATTQRTGDVAVTLAHADGQVSEFLLTGPIGDARFRVDGDTVAVRIDGEGTLLASGPIDAPCETFAVTREAPEVDALTATRIVDTFELCQDRGITARERVTTFPLGERRVQWRHVAP